MTTERPAAVDPDAALGDPPAAGSPPSRRGGRAAISAAFFVATVWLVGTFVERGPPDVASGSGLGGSTSPRTTASPDAQASPDASVADPIGPAVAPTGSGRCAAPQPPIPPVRGRADPEASIVATYRFADTLQPSSGGARALAPEGQEELTFARQIVSGSARRTVLTFDRGTGLSLAPPDPLSVGKGYTIELLFRLDRVADYRKIVDFSGGASDDGLYVLNGCLTFFPLAVGDLPAIEGDRYVHVVLTRDEAGTVVGYVNGVRWLGFRDEAGRAVIDPAGVLRFFVDDLRTSGEASSGSVAALRLYDGAMGPDRVARACVELLEHPCWPTSEQFVDRIRLVCDGATRRFQRFDGVPGASADGLAGWFAEMARASSRSLAGLRLLTPPRGMGREELSRLLAPLKHPIDVLRASARTAARSDADLGQRLWERAVAAFQLKDERVVTLGRSELGLTLQSCPIAPPQ